MMAFILATDFDFIAYMSKMAFFFLEAFFTPMAFLEYDLNVYQNVELNGPYHQTKFERNRSVNVSIQANIKVFFKTKSQK